MDEKIRRLVTWANGEPTPPVTIECHITNCCNLNCKFCWLQVADPKTFKPEITHERFLSLVEESADLGAQEWRIIGGGEPLIRIRTAKVMMHRIKELGMFGMLTTNGVLLETPVIQQIVADRWDVVTFSLDGPDSETHDFLRGKSGAFEAARQAMLGLKQAKLSDHSELPEIRFHTVLCTHNVKKLDRILDLAAEVGCGQVLLQPMTIYSDGMRPLALSAEDKLFLDGHLDSLIHLAERQGIWTNFAGMRESDLVTKTTAMHEVIKGDTEDFRNEHPFLKIPCYEPWYLMLLRPDGLVTPCNKFDYDGDDGATKHLRDIWYGDFFSRIRETLAEGRLLPICATCCVGGVLENRRIREQIRGELRTRSTTEKMDRIETGGPIKARSSLFKRILRHARALTGR